MSFCGTLAGGAWRARVLISPDAWTGRAPRSSVCTLSRPASARGPIARPTTALSARLGRHALLLQARALRHLAGRIQEPIVLDHFETFEFTQDFPFGVATPVGTQSWFVYGLDPAPPARAGRRSTTQQR